MNTVPRISAASRKEAEKRIEDPTRMTAARRSRIYALELAKLGATAKHYPQERRASGKLNDSRGQGLPLHPFFPPRFHFHSPPFFPHPECPRGVHIPPSLFLGRHP